MSLLHKLFGTGEVLSKTGLNEFKVELLSKEAKNQLRLMQQRGVSSIPKKGDYVLCVFPGAERDNGIIIASDTSDKPDLKEGDAALHTSKDHYLHLKDDGNSAMKTKKLEFDGELRIKNDSLVVDGVNILKTLRELQGKYNTHIHTCAAPNSPTSTVTKTVPPLPFQESKEVKQ